MADAIARTSAPDLVNGNPVDVTTVTTGAGTTDRQCVSIGDPSANTRAAVGANGLKVDGSGVTQPISNAAITSIDGKTPALGQALAAASWPVVMTAAQITTLTPPAAITGFALEAGHLAAIDTSTAAAATAANQTTELASLAAISAALGGTPSASNPAPYGSVPDLLIKLGKKLDAQQAALAALVAAQVKPPVRPSSLLYFIGR